MLISKAMVILAQDHNKWYCFSGRIHQNSQAVPVPSFWWNICGTYVSSVRLLSFSFDTSVLDHGCLILTQHCLIPSMDLHWGRKDLRVFRNSKTWNPCLPEVQICEASQLALFSGLLIINAFDSEKFVKSQNSVSSLHILVFVSSVTAVLTIW